MGLLSVALERHAIACDGPCETYIFMYYRNIQQMDLMELLSVASEEVLADGCDEATVKLVLASIVHNVMKHRG